MPWYDGPTLLEHLETIELAADRNLDDRRFPVQWVIRPMADEHHDYRGYAGQVAGGMWRAGDEVVVLPSGRRTRVAAVETVDGAARRGDPRPVGDDPARGRHRRLARRPARRSRRPPVVARELTARVCWMSERPLEAARACSSSTRRARSRARVDEIVSVVDIATLEDRPSPGRLELNDLGVVRFRLAEPLAVDPYARNRATGAFILDRRGDERHRRRRHGGRCGVTRAPIPTATPT